MSRKSLLAIGLGALLVLACAVVGYLLGRAEAPTTAEWRAEKSQSQAQAREAAAVEAFASAKPRGRQKGFELGKTRGARLGREKGAEDGSKAADEVLIALEEEEAEEREEQAELEYVSQLPNGDPGYALPEEERSVACVGISAVTGECVGD